MDTTRLLPEEPIAADVRVKDTEPPREMRATERDQPDRRALLDFMKLKLIAGLMGAGLDELVQRDKVRQVENARQRARKARRLSIAFGLLATVAIAAGGVAWRERSSAITSRAKAEEALAAFKRERVAAFDSTNRWLIGDSFCAAPTIHGGLLSEGQAVRYLVPVTKGLEYAFVTKPGNDPDCEVAMYAYEESGKELDSAGSSLCRWFHIKASYDGTVIIYLHAVHGTGHAEFVVFRRGI